MNSRRCYRYPGFLILCFIFALGCGPQQDRVFEHPTIPYQEALGPAQVTVVSVTPFAEVATDLQPTFDLSTKDALDSVAPNTLFLSDQTLNAVSAKLGIGLPTDSRSSTETKASTGGAAPTVTDTGTITTAAGVAPTPTSANPTRTMAAFPFSTSTPGIEPNLKYDLARALLQYVRLSNRYINDRLFTEEYDAYVVRLQVGLTPTKRDMPYDTFVDVMFLPSDTKTETKQIDENAESQGTFRLQYQTPKLPDKGSNEPGVIVVPLLTLDSIEGLLRSRSNEEVRDIALSLAATVQNAGAKFDVGSFLDDVETALGRDFNSVVSINTRSDSILRIRLGALQQARTKYGIVPRQQTVSAVVLRRHDDSNTAQLSAVALTKFVDAINGDVPRRRKPSERLADYKLIASDYLPKNVRLTSGQLEALGQLAENRNFNEFSKQLDMACSKGTNKYKGPKDLGVGLTVAAPMWFEFTAAANAAGRPQVMTFNLPGPKIPNEMPSAAQTVFLADDGQKMTTTLYAGQNLSYYTGVGLLTITPPAPAHPITFMDDAVSVAPGGRELRLTFPSMAGAKIADTSALKLHVDLETKQKGLKDKLHEDYDHFLYVPTKSEAPAKVAKAEPELTPLVGQAGAWSIPVTITAGSGQAYYLRVSPGAIADVTGDSGVVEHDGDNWAIKKDGHIILKITGLNPTNDKSVAVTVTDKDRATKGGASVPIKS